MGSITFAAPAGLWILAGVVPLVGMYVLRARRVRVRVSSTLLWAAARRDMLARTPWQKLRPEVSLLLELLGLIALAITAARPTLRRSDASAERVAIVIDTSASMGAIEPEGPRFDLARAAAQRVLQGLSDGSEAMVITAGRSARVVAPMGRERDPVTTTLTRLSAEDSEGTLDDAIALAVDRLRGLGGRRRVVVISDAAVARGPGYVARDVPVELVKIGVPRDNVALVRMDVRVGLREGVGERVQVFVLAANLGEQPVRATVGVRLDGERSPRATENVTLAPGQRTPVTLEFPFVPSEVGAGIVAEISPGGALAVDDQGYGRVPPGASLPVVMVAEADDPWLHRALAADPQVVLTTATSDPGARALDGALVVYDGLCPATLPPRDVLVLSPPPGPCAGLTVAEPDAVGDITSYATSDARLRFLTMDGVHFARGSALALSARATELLRTGDSVLMADASDADRVVTVLGVDLGASDWPLRASFVVFVRNVVERSRARRIERTQGGGRAGDPLRVSVPPGVSEVRVSSPDGRSTVRAAAGLALLGETPHVGLYTARWNNGETLLPVNLLSESESDLRRTPWQLTAAPPERRTSALTAPRDEVGGWLSSIAALALLADLWWLSRAPSRRTPNPRPEAA